MQIKIEKADLKDINELVQIRIEYLTEDYGSLRACSVSFKNNTNKS